MTPYETHHYRWAVDRMESRLDYLKAIRQLLIDRRWFINEQLAQIERQGRPWPSRDEFRRMSPADVNRFFASRGSSWRVAE